MDPNDHPVQCLSITGREVEPQTGEEICPQLQDGGTETVAEVV